MAIKTFRTNKKPVQFKIDDDTFEAAPEVPAGLMIDLVKLRSELDRSESHRQFDLVLELFAEVFTPESYAKFEERLRDRKNPIGLPTLLDVSKYLLGEVYGGRPTQSPPSSRDRSAATTGTGSTDGVPPEESTRSTSPGNGS